MYSTSRPQFKCTNTYTYAYIYVHIFHKKSNDNIKKYMSHNMALKSLETFFTPLIQLSVCYIGNFRPPPAQSI